MANEFKAVGTFAEILEQLIFCKKEADPRKIYELTVIPHGEKRGLTANAYYWQLVRKYAEWSGNSEQYVHNDVLWHYGITETINGITIHVVLPDTDEYMEWSDYHYFPTKQTFVGKDKVTYRTYIVKRDSHKYNTKEFSRLIDGLILMIKGADAPIETMTPNQLAQLENYEKAT